MPIVKVPPAPNASPIQIEVDTAPGDVSVYGEVRDGKAAKVLSSARDLFGDGLELARGCAVRVANALDAMSRETALDEFTISFLRANVGRTDEDRRPLCV